MKKHNMELEINICEDIPIKYDYSKCEIQYLDICDLKYNNFYENYMLKNIPCIIKNVSASWLCSIDWVEDDNINYRHLEQHYGDEVAPVADCQEISFNSHCKTNMKVRDYMNYLKNPTKDKLLYLKDWHLKRLKRDENFYEVPHIFASDWLNEFAIDHEDDDFMFVYIGAQNTWTPLHADVYSSYSWSVNVIGRKKWVLFPPGEEEKLKDSLGNLPLLFHAHEFIDVRHIEIVQERGDAIFVPSGWHHQVFNELETISINHNFVNACNIHFVWEALQRHLISVENEIKEFRETPEFTSQCQLILKSLFGMDFESFINFITYIANKRLDLKNNKQYKLFNMYNIGKSQIDYDLCIILKTIICLLNHPLIVANHLPQNVTLKLINVRDNINNAIGKKMSEVKV